MNFILIMVWEVFILLGYFTYETEAQEIKTYGRIYIRAYIGMTPKPLLFPYHSLILHHLKPGWWVGRGLLYNIHFGQSVRYSLNSDKCVPLQQRTLERACLSQHKSIHPSESDGSHSLRRRWLPLVDIRGHAVFSSCICGAQSSVPELFFAVDWGELQWSIRETGSQQPMSSERHPWDRMVYWGGQKEREEPEG